MFILRKSFCSPIAQTIPQNIMHNILHFCAPLAPNLNLLRIIAFIINFFREEPLCVLCEYAMKVLLQESGIMSNRTIDMAEHAVEMLCSYMPVSILYKYQNTKFQNLN